jgi:hypothetical protein
MARLLVTAVLAALVAATLMYFFKPQEPAPRVDVSIESIQRVAELATIRFNEAVMYPYKKPKKFLEWKNAKLLVLAKGTVVGRVDLKKASMERDEEARTVTIRFAKDAVIVSDPEIKKLEVITLANPNIFHPLNDDDRNKATKNAMGLLKSTAIDGGIREMTKDEAVTVLSAFVSELGYTAEVVFAK